MKKLMLILATFCVVGGASAITATWTTGSNNSVYEGKSVYDQNGGESLKGRPYSFAAVVAISGIPSGNNNTLIHLAQWSGGNTNINLYGSESTDKGSLGVNSNNSWGGVTNIPGIENASKEAPIKISVIVTYENNEMTVYFNGQSAFTMTHTNMDGLAITTSDGDAWDFLETAGYQGVLSAEEIAYLSDNKTAVTLPEPTALALLALGVAGLALRRKVA